MTFCMGRLFRCCGNKRGGGKSYGGGEIGAEATQIFFCFNDPYLPVQKTNHGAIIMRMDQKAEMV